MYEPESDWFIQQIKDATDRRMSAPTALELGIVLEGRLPNLTGTAARAVRDSQITIVDFTADLADRGMHAWRRFGKGRHPASLNFGDCCTYALAEQTGFPILCLGNDFAHTDLPVLRPPAS
jgi:ribonuclease VapC